MDLNRIEAVDLTISQIPSRRLAPCPGAKDRLCSESNSARLKMPVRWRKAIVDTVREPLVVLDKDLRAIAASRSFYVKFTTNPDDT